MNRRLLGKEKSLNDPIKDEHGGLNGKIGS